MDSAPHDDEIGPIFSELKQIHHELGSLESELKRLEDIETQEKSLVKILNSQIREKLSKKHKDKRRVSGIELGEKVQDVLQEYSRILRNKKLELLESYSLDAMKMLLHNANINDAREEWKMSQAVGHHPNLINTVDYEENVKCVYARVLFVLL